MNSNDPRLYTYIQICQELASINNRMLELDYVTTQLAEIERDALWRRRADLVLEKLRLTGGCVR